MFYQHRLLGVVVLGDLSIWRTIQLDAGPLFFVEGNLRAGHIDKGILGNMPIDGLVLCDYNKNCILFMEKTHQTWGASWLYRQSA